MGGIERVELSAQDRTDLNVTITLNPFYIFNSY